MGKDKKRPYFQLIKSFPLAAKPVMLSFFMFLLIPTHPLKEGSSHWIEASQSGRRKEDFELLRIYSVLKSRMELKDATIWKIAETILEESLQHSLDPMLVLAIITIESRFQHKAVSAEGARGLMQINPQIADSLAKEAEIALWSGEKSLDDPVLNIKLGVFYLGHLKKTFRDLKLALTAYNWGPTEVKNRLAEERTVPQDYAAKVLSAYRSLRRTDRQTH